MLRTRLGFAVASAALLSAVVVAIVAIDSSEPAQGLNQVWIVNTTADPAPGACEDAPGNCTLREAINKANAAPNTQIWFELPGCPDACTISVGPSPLPEITAAGIVVDGSTQPGGGRLVVDFSAQAFGAGLKFGNGADGGSVTGMDLTHAPGTSIQILADDVALTDVEISGDGGGVDVYGHGATIIASRIIGNGSVGVQANDVGGGEISGSQVSGNNDNGILLCGPDWSVRESTVNDNNGTGISTNQCGGDARPVELLDNEISGNEVGVALSAGGVVSANTISENSSGLFVYAGEVEITDNSVTDSAGIGIEVQSQTEAQIQGNTITGSGSHGISLDGVQSVVGGLGAGEPNEIAGNGGAGIFVREENDDGGEVRAAGGSGGLDITLSGNRISDNGGLGIDLSPTGVNQNDEGDSDQGANRRQNAPELISATAGSLSVSLQMDSRPEADIRIELFANSSCDGSGHGEGAEFIGFADIELPVSGVLDTVVESDEDVDPGQFITATATNLDTRDTSEFSNCVALQGKPTPSPTPTGTPGPTSTATPSPGPTETGVPTPTSSPVAEAAQGDVDCDGDEDSVDALKVLRHVASLGVVQTEPCDDIGTGLARLAASGTITGVGDADCDLDVDSVDALKILRHVASLPVQQMEPCRDIGT